MSSPILRLRLPLWAVAGLTAARGVPAGARLGTGAGCGGTKAGLSAALADTLISISAAKRKVFIKFLWLTSIQ
ncbi:hypothetical protein IMCC9480_1965 [Oxalobacteraceae bacterium IMCC9480]|nr:hypothetical protein IMCC9480_1965 [Oxalobacteraceae bacterium IMCC9480]